MYTNQHASRNFLWKKKPNYVVMNTAGAALAPIGSLPKHRKKQLES